MNKLYLIDASPYIFRAWFGMPDVFFDAEQRPVNAVYGFGLFIRDWLVRHDPRHAVFCFDESLESGFRHRLYPDYKANRALPDESLEFQLLACRELAESIGISCIASELYEADDLIGSIAHQAKQYQTEVVIHSTDKDLSQLVSVNCSVDPFYKEDIISLAVFEKNYGFAPSLLADYLALAGDPVDNIPGIDGIGKKSAQKLIQYFGGLENLYAELASTEAISGLRGFASVKNRLQQEKELAFLFRELTRIHIDAPVSSNEQAWVLNKSKRNRLEETLKKWSLEKRLQSLSILLE